MSYQPGAPSKGDSLSQLVQQRSGGFPKKITSAWTWWIMPVIPAYRRQTQEALQLEFSMGYIGRPCLQKGRNERRKEGRKEKREEGRKERGKKGGREEGKYSLISPLPCKIIEIT
jgi:hypothetical protein